MTYLFTYKNGKKALGITNNNNGLAIKAGNKTVYPLLVAPTAENASCVRTKINNQIKSIAYVPTLILPVLLCRKEGSSYLDASGINYINKYYQGCYFDRVYGHYISFNSYYGNFTAAISYDGKNWTEGNIGGTTEYTTYKVINTNSGVIIFRFEVDVISQYRSELYIRGYTVYKSGNTFQRQRRFSRLISTCDFEDWWNNWDCDQLWATTNGDNKVLLYYRIFIEHPHAQFQQDQQLLSIDLNTNVTTYIDNERKRAIWYNKLLNKYFYKTYETSSIYISSDGINFNYTSTDYKISYGNLNGYEVLENGLSNDGINVIAPYTYRPNIYDPIENKYIRISTGASAESGKWRPFVDIYETTNLQSWSKVVTKSYPTLLQYQTTLDEVNTDGFAGVQGF